MRQPVYAEVRKWYNLLVDPKWANKQTRNRLKDDDGYCCLGLYTEKCGFPFLQKRDAESSFGRVTFLYKNTEDKTAPGGWKYEEGTSQSESGLMPYPAAAVFWGSRMDCTTNPTLNIPSHLQGRRIVSETNSSAATIDKHSATSLNDDFGFTFAEIAECVKFTWPEAFEEVEEAHEDSEI